MSESLRFFQYLAGERKGEVLVLKGIIEEDGMVFLEFRDLSRCNEELVLPLNERNYTNQLMAEVSDPNNVWVMKEERVGGEEEKWAENADGLRVCVQEYVEGKLRVIPVPPRKVNSNFGAITERSITPEPTQPTAQEPEKKLLASGDPVYGMMEASKKFPTPVEVEISIMLPKKSLFEVANESFEDGGKKVVEYIIENLDISDLKDALRRSLYEAYGQSLQEESEELTTAELLLDQPVIEKDESERVEEISGKLEAQITVEPVLADVPIIDGEPEAVEEPVIGEPVAGIPAN